MKIMNVSASFYQLRMPLPTFRAIVDYGAKDKDLIYVPILFDESEDSYINSKEATLPENSSKQLQPEAKKKLSVKSLAGKGIATLAGIEVLPDVAKNTMDKVSDLIESSTNFANDTIDKVSDVKEHYKERFPKNVENLDNSALLAETNNISKDDVNFAHDIMLNGSESDIKKTDETKEVVTDDDDDDDTDDDYDYDDYI